MQWCKQLRDALRIDEVGEAIADKIDDILSAIDDIHRHEQLSFLLVEQDVQIALERAHRGYVLESGRVVLHGPASELLKSKEIRTVYLGDKPNLSCTDGNMYPDQAYLHVLLVSPDGHL